MKNKKIIILVLLFISFCFLLFCLFNFYKLYDSKIKVYEKQKSTYENLKKENRYIINSCFYGVWRNNIYFN